MYKTYNYVFGKNVHFTVSLDNKYSARLSNAFLKQAVKIFTKYVKMRITLKHCCKTWQESQWPRCSISCCKVPKTSTLGWKMWQRERADCWLKLFWRAVRVICICFCGRRLYLGQWIPLLGSTDVNCLTNPCLTKAVSQTACRDLTLPSPCSTHPLLCALCSLGQHLWLQLQFKLVFPSPCSVSFLF